METNQLLTDDPKVLNKDPYGRGWFAVLHPVGGPSILRPLDQVAGELRSRLEELGVRCFGEFPDLELFEIGVECSAVLVKLNELLSSSERGAVIHVVSDDQSAEIEMERWAEETGNRLIETSREGELRHFIVRKA